MMKIRKKIFEMKGQLNIHDYKKTIFHLQDGIEKKQKILQAPLLLLKAMHIILLKRKL